MTIGEQRTCARPGCDAPPFISKTSNQKYHDDECCRLATNAKIMEKYYANKARVSGQTRYCNTCEITKLSRYNDSLTCSSCSSKRTVELNQSAANMLIAIG